MNRLPWIDNLIALMIILVVMVHAGVTYSGIGSWYYVENKNIGLGSALFKTTLYSKINIPFGLKTINVIILILFITIFAFFTRLFLPMLKSIILSPVIKFFMISTVVIPLTFILSWLIRRIKPFRKIFS